jgi:Tol biopolymer transport system component
VICALVWSLGIGYPNSITPQTSNTNNIVFEMAEDSPEEIFTMRSDGSNITKLTDNDIIDAEPSWSPDLSRIVFVSNRDGNFEIYVMNADGSDQTRLTVNNAADRVPHWSPDRKNIVFSSDRDGKFFNIFRMDTDGTNQINLSQSRSNDSYPSYAPDGSRLAFSSDRNGNSEIYLMNSDGSNQTRLTFTNQVAILPRWSPDESKIAFRGDRENFFYVSANGGPVHQITSGEGDTGSFGWAGNNQIVFINHGLILIDLDGTGRLPLSMLWPQHIGQFSTPSNWQLPVDSLNPTPQM